uniref:Aminotransferase class I/classII domain-containing protein n=1 Tax=Parascaris univalens TaxID=6257 RepID=A0A915C7L5_PARUN
MCLLIPAIRPAKCCRERTSKRLFGLPSSTGFS